MKISFPEALKLYNLYNLGSITASSNAQTSYRSVKLFAAARLILTDFEVEILIEPSDKVSLLIVEKSVYKNIFILQSSFFFVAGNN